MPIFLEHMDRYYLSPQEHRLIGSTVPADCIDRFYVPLAVQRGAPIDEVDRVRQEYGTYYAHNYVIEDAERIYGLHNLIGVCRMILSRLDLQTGETLEDPRPLDAGLCLSKKDRYRLRP